MSSIRDKYNTGRTVFSCEVFPPKKDQPIEPAMEKIKDFRDIAPEAMRDTLWR